jgi:DNA-binding transcriptional regulator PaaX
VELDPLLEAERLPAERFVASYDGDPRGLLARAWNLDGLGRAYQRWLAEAGELIAAVGPDAPDPAVFALRSALVHECRKFLFTDPGFPGALLPAGWPGHEAARLFHAESARLLPGASRFVDCCLRKRIREHAVTSTGRAFARLNRTRVSQGWEDRVRSKRPAFASARKWRSFRPTTPPARGTYCNRHHLIRLATSTHPPLCWLRRAFRQRA